MHGITMIEAMRNALAFLEANGFTGGDIHDDLSLAILKVSGMPEVANVELDNERKSSVPVAYLVVKDRYLTNREITEVPDSVWITQEGAQRRVDNLTAGETVVYSSLLGAKSARVVKVELNKPQAVGSL